MSELNAEQEAIWARKRKREKEAAQEAAAKPSKKRKGGMARSNIPWWSSRRETKVVLGPEREALLVDLRKVPYGSFEPWDDGNKLPPPIDAPCVNHMYAEVDGGLKLPRCVDCARMRLDYKRRHDQHDMGCTSHCCRTAKKILLELKGEHFDG